MSRAKPATFAPIDAPAPKPEAFTLGALTVSGAAREFAVSRNTVRKILHSGEVDVARFDSYLRICRASLAAYFRRHRVKLAGLRLVR